MLLVAIAHARWDVWLVHLAALGALSLFVTEELLQLRNRSSVSHLDMKILGVISGVAGMHLLAARLLHTVIGP
eukprot:SAG31_NODE_16099_length_723_cov_0.737179_2_plen_72_part_01